MSQKGERKIDVNLLELSEHWTEHEINEKYQDLLEIIHPILLDECSEYGQRLNCVRIVSEKIARLIPVYEAEDSIFLPLLNGVLTFLRDVFSSVSSQDDDSQVQLLSVATNLIEHTDVLLQQSFRYEGMGPGEIPSLPKVIPKILLSTFNCCITELSQASSEKVKGSINLLFIRARSLLKNFTALVDNLKIRTALEDELDILIDLCTDLVSFHQVLFAVDLKSCIVVWNLFVKLTKKYEENLRMKLDIEAPLLVLLKEVVQTFEALEIILKSETQRPSKELTRLIIALSFLIKTLSGLAENYKNFVNTNLDIFLDFISFMILEGNNLLPYIDPNIGKKLKAETFHDGQTQMFLISLPNLDCLCAHICSRETRPEESVAHVRIVVSLLLSDQISDQSKSDCFHKLFTALRLTESELQKRDFLESFEVPGVQISFVGLYEWTLTRVCRFLSTLLPENFPTVERTIFEHLIGDSNLVGQFCSDLLCFIGRYGSSDLCFAHLTTISKIYSNFRPGFFVNQCFWFESLVGRLFNFLAPKERNLWLEMFSPKEDNNLMLWSGINFGLIERSEILQSLLTACQEKYSQIADESAEDCSPIILTSILKIFRGLVRINKDFNFNSIVFTLWRKFAEGNYYAGCALWVEELFTELSDLTVQILPNLSKANVKSLVSLLLIVSNRVEYNLVKNITSILDGINRLDWVLQTKDIDPCLVTDIGRMSSAALYSAAENPLLKVRALIYVRNMANTSFYIRLCSSQEDVSLFHNLLREGEDLSFEENTDFNVDFGAPNLASFAKKALLSENEPKRRLSVSAPNSPRNKRPRRKSQEKFDDANSLLSVLEQNLEELDHLIARDPNQALSPEQKSKLRSLLDKVLSK